MEKFLNYRPARYVGSKKNAYVAYSVVNPETGNFVVKRIKLNYIKSSRQRKAYAEELIKQINGKLSVGYNPFLTEATDKLILLSEAVTEFLRQKRRELDTRTICADTFADYNQHLKIFTEYLCNDLFCFKIKTATVNAFLDYIYIDKQLTAITRNHYLQTLKTFFTFCKNRDYIAENPTNTITALKAGVKKRKAIPEATIKQIFDYLRYKDKYYLLACYLLYGCFIRPTEICKLKINSLNFSKQTIFISAEISKNKKAQTVTIPKNILLYMLDLEIYKYPSEYYIIGKTFAPNQQATTSHVLRNRWDKLRRELNFAPAYQFYSLKDSGITKMINLLNVAEVRDQARHHNISITDVYTDRAARNDGNGNIKKMDFEPGTRV